MSSPNARGGIQDFAGDAPVRRLWPRREYSSSFQASRHSLVGTRRLEGLRECLQLLRADQSVHASRHLLPLAARGFEARRLG